MQKLLITYILFSLCIAAASAQGNTWTDRGFGQKNSQFIQKGYACTGFSAYYNNYGSNDAEGYDLFSVVEGLKGRFSAYGITPSFSYFIKDNMSAGIRLGYDRTDFNLDDANLSLDDDTNMDLSNHYLKSDKYYTALIIRNYLPLYGSRVFALFNETRLTGSLGQSKSYKKDGNDKDGTFTRTYGVGLGFYPGICAFISNEMAFEASLNVLGVEYSLSEQTKNQIYKSNLSHFRTDCRVRLMTLNLGIVYYFHTGK
ncbi:MAG: hypothetical protein LKI42_05550 [Bacteroidales bacterium]|jgi:hypothetical protein|nr:hypothetical protein [Bacteroidales bacterium]MCI1785908.1 hypothetical protein [Bacteroidales bacterium]